MKHSHLKQRLNGKARKHFNAPVNGLLSLHDDVTNGSLWDTQWEFPERFEWEFDFGSHNFIGLKFMGNIRGDGVYSM